MGEKEEQFLQLQLQMNSIERNSYRIPQHTTNNRIQHTFAISPPISVFNSFSCSCFHHIVPASTQPPPNKSKQKVYTYGMTVVHPHHHRSLSDSYTPIMMRCIYRYYIETFPWNMAHLTLLQDSPFHQILVCHLKLERRTIE